MVQALSKPLSYRDAGVDIEAGDELVERIKPLARLTRRAECIGSIGGFGGLFQLAGEKYREPVLVAGADGVGTKLKLAVEADRHRGVGIDLVAMCVNDVVACGAEPLFFLDYFAAARLDPVRGETVISGIAEGCRRAGAALLGGESAEMPGLYAPGDYDLAGFAVGVVEKSDIIDGSRVEAGDALVGIASSGPHANGFSLIRKILATTGARLDARLGDATLADLLLEPTRIYARPLLAAFERVEVHGLAHVTGGGLPGNVGRVIGAGLRAVIDARALRRPEIFDWIRSAGNVAEPEMLRTFNCGVGMVAIVDRDDAELFIAVLRERGERAFTIGRVERGDGEVIVR